MRVNFQTIKINTNYTKKQTKTNPISFGAFRCSEENFEIKKIPYLHCPICGLLMLKPEEQKTFVNDVASKKGEALKTALEKYEDESVFVKDNSSNRRKTIYREQKQEVVNILKQMALEYPDLAIAELVRLKAKTSLDELIKKQFVVFDEIENYINTSITNEKERELSLRILNNYKKNAKGESSTKFKRKSFIENIQAPISDKIQKKEIKAIAEKLPTSDSEISAFFVKYSDPSRSSKEIASKLVEQTLPSTEHLIPKSKQGQNKTNNYICDCRDCNSTRGNILFDEWIEGKEITIQQGLQQYLKDVQKAIDTGVVNSKYDDYIAEIIETISRISNGEIKLTMPQTTNSEKQQAIFEKRKIEINKIGRKLGKMIEKIRALNKEIAFLEKHPQFNSITQLTIVKRRIQELKKQNLNLENSLETEQNKKEEYLAILTEIMELEAKLKDCDEKEAALINLEIKNMNKTLQSNLLNQCDERIIQILKNIESNEEELSNLSQKEALLEKILNSNSQPAIQIDELKALIKEIESIQRQIKNLESSLLDKPNLEKKLADLEKENKKLQYENETLLKEAKINPEDRTEYKKLLHYRALYEVTIKLGQYPSSKNKGNSLTDIQEIAQIAQEEILKKIFELSEKNEIKYFTNSDTIQANEKQIGLIKSKLEKLEKATQSLNELKTKYSNLGQGKSLEELRTLYEKLQSEEAARKKIENIQEIRTELKNLEDTLTYNLEILEKLKKEYRSLSEEQFRTLTGLIYA